MFYFIFQVCLRKQKAYRIPVFAGDFVYYQGAVLYSRHGSKFSVRYIPALSLSGRQDERNGLLEVFGNTAGANLKQNLLCLQPGCGCVICLRFGVVGQPTNPLARPHGLPCREMKKKISLLLSVVWIKEGWGVALYKH